ncbi:MAG TPA: carboxypeptidase regulatory-like domain-containing protein [Bryobacteraceae bacterium]|nr:carboxypeptidase regulatory-like domain-containing protein [Bryobacteraceae bacterium]
MRFIVLLAGFVLLSAGPAAGQTGLGDLKASFRLHGYVTDLTYRPISDARVKLVGEGADDSTIEIMTLDGYFDKAVPPGKYRVTIQHPNYRQTERSVDAWAGGYRNMDVRMETLLPTIDLPGGQAPVEITTCDLDRRAADFEGRAVRFRASFSDSARDRQFYLSNGSCDIAGYFSKPAKPSAEEFLKDEFYSSKRLVVEATLTGRVVVLPRNNFFPKGLFQIALDEISDIHEGEKLTRIWVTGRLVDPGGRPLPYESLSISAPRQQFQIPYDDLSGITAEWDGTFKVPAIAPASVTLRALRYDFRRTFHTAKGLNVVLGDVVIKDADARK